MKYIVKNCPSCRYTPKRYIDGIDYICWNAQNFNSSARGLCQDCADCVIKRVIEKCKEETKPIRIYEDKDKGTAIAEYSLSKDFAQAILDMFEIQEIKE